MEMKPFTELFSDFQKPTAEQWEQRILSELKGKPADILNNRIGKTTLPGYIHPESSSGAHEGLVSGQATWPGHPNAWLIGFNCNENQVESAHKKVLSALQWGCGSVYTQSDEWDENDLKVFLNGIHLEMIDIHLHTSSPKRLLADLLGVASCQPKDMHGSIGCDFLSNAAQCGQEVSPSAWIELAELIRSRNHSLDLVLVDGSIYRKGGGRNMHVLGAMLSKLNEQLTQLIQEDVQAHEVFSCLRLKYPLSTHYLEDIASIRALRAGVLSMAKKYGVSTEEIRIDAVALENEFSHLDHDTNILRGTSMALSAACAGARSICLPSFNLNNDDFGWRITRNISHILNEESYLSRVNDPLKGSYVIETLTETALKEAWEILLMIEKQGGYLAYLQSGGLSDFFRQLLNQRQASVLSGKEVRIGVNKYLKASPDGIYTSATAEPKGEFPAIMTQTIDQMKEVSHA